MKRKSSRPPARKQIPSTIRAAVPSPPKKNISGHEIPTELQFEGTCELEATEVGAEVPPGGERFYLIANTGKPMDLEGFYDPVIIDLEGAKFDKKKTAIIADHDTAKRIGHTTQQQIVQAGMTGKIGNKSLTGPVIAATGVRSSKMAVAIGFVEDSKEGFPFQVSVGAKIKEGYFVAEGETAKVNGKTWKGPLIVASKTLVRELSVLVLGADNDTATIAARAKPLKETDMDFEAYIKSLHLDLESLSAEAVTALKAQWSKSQDEPPVFKKKGKRRITASDPDDDEDDDDEEVKPRNRRIAARQPVDTSIAIADEEERCDAIRAAAVAFEGLKEVTIELSGKEVKMSIPKLKAHAIRSKWTPETFELHCRRSEYPEPGAAPAIHPKDSNVESQVLEASILRSFGQMPLKAISPSSKREYGLEAMFKPEILEKSHEKQYRLTGSIEELMSLQVRAAGRYPVARHGTDLLAECHRAWSDIKASGFSTLSLTNILENVMNKTALASFEAVEGVWRRITGRRPVNDFKPHALYRLDFTGHFRKVASDGELKHISMIDTKKTIQAETFGAMITIDRKTQRDDDLGLVMDKARGLGMLGAQRIEESVMALLLSNPGSFFAGGNGNLLTGAGSALSMTSLETARQSFWNQVVNGKPVGIAPTLLLVGTTSITNARQLYTNETVTVTTTADLKTFTSNPNVGLYEPIVSPYLNNTSVTDQDGNAISGQSATQWYLFPNPNAPQGSACVIAFMDGRETPYFDEAETQFNIPGGIQLRAYLDWGNAMHFTQLALKSAGA